METMTKKELLEKLALIEKDEKEIKDELFYQKYKDLSFWEITKKGILWKKIIIICILFDFIGLLDYKNILLFIVGGPLLMGLAVLSNVLEIYQKINFMKKRRNEEI